MSLSLPSLQPAVMKIAVVTGAAGGIGTAVCALLVEHGWTVIGIDRCLGGASPCQHMLHMDICNLGGENDSLVGNTATGEPSAKRQQSGVHSGKQLKELLAALSPTAPRCDLLVCNAAVQRLGRLQDLTLDDFTETLAVNVTAPAMMIQLLLAELQAAGGSVVNISSIHANLTKPGFSAYAASKGGLVSLTKALAVELGPLGVRVNAVLPAACNTAMLRAGFEAARNVEGMEQLQRLHPVQRICEPREIAEFIMFLSDASKSGFINGSALQIDGGIGARLLDPDVFASNNDTPFTPVT